jgi:hypothetical protein
MANSPTNLAASIKDRLLKIARAETRVFETLLVRFALERLLYRLSISIFRDRFILKGGMLVTAWTGNENRTTKDADFLGHGDAAPEDLIATFATIMALEVDDGLAFDADALKATPIRENTQYGGTRLQTIAYLERTRIPITIDIGFGDVITDPTHQIDYPSLLDLPSANLRAYSPATVLAEKFQAIVALGELNGRMKDYFDLWAIPQALTIAPDDLDVALQATFERRLTAIPANRPIGLSNVMIESAIKQRQWRAYAVSVGEDGLDFAHVIEAIWKIIGPSCSRIIARQTSPAP